MSGLLSSPRRRRRLIWGGAGALVVVGVAFSMVHWSNTAHEPPETFASGPYVPPEPPPKPAPFAQARKEGVLRTAAQFVATAVARKNVERSWKLTAPSLRSGYTKRTWSTADIPVQPYPVDAARWGVDYSWEDTVGLKVALFPLPKADVPAAVFDMQLRAFGAGKHRRWLVDSWTPSSYVGIPSGPLGSSRAAAIPRFEKGRVGTMWVFAPVGVFLLLGLLLTFHFGRDWWIGKRAARRYRATLS
jgi:hypothetical protein